MVGRRGVPLAAGLTGANRPDCTVFAALLDAAEPIERSRGRPRRRPATLHADKGYDVRHCRASLRRRGIADRIARKGVEDKTRLGRHRWVVERTLAWLARYRRLAILPRAPRRHPPGPPRPRLRPHLPQRPPPPGWVLLEPEGIS